MKRLKVKAPAFVVNGTIGGHPFINHKNHASGGALVQLPAVQKNIAKLTNKSSNASRAAIKSANAKGAV